MNNGISAPEMWVLVTLYFPDFGVALYSWVFLSLKEKNTEVLIIKAQGSCEGEWW